MYVGGPRGWGIAGGEEGLQSLARDGGLEVPEGWTFRSRVLEEDLVIEGSEGVTMVVSDEFRNVYSKHDGEVDPAICPGFLEESSATEDLPLVKSVVLALTLFSTLCLLW